jgi:release factor glutamine methyltransferase
MASTPRERSGAAGGHEVSAERDTVPWRAFVDEATERLRGAGTVSPEVDARRIVERASGSEGADYHRALDRPAGTRAVAFFEAMLARRVAGEPLQYVLGAWGFRTLELLVDERVLIPRPETETVVERALAELDRRRRRHNAGDAPLTAVDLGTGSGAIALSLAAERAGVQVWATDVSAAALEVARANLAGLGSAATRVRLVEGDWFGALPGSLRGAVDLIVSNPPYVAAGEDLPAEVRDWEPATALVAGPTGLEALAALVDQAGSWLAPGGALVVELAPHQAAAVADRSRAMGYTPVEVGTDLAGRDRLVVARHTPR